LAVAALVARRRRAFGVTVAGASLPRSPASTARNPSAALPGAPLRSAPSGAPRLWPAGLLVRSCRPPPPWRRSMAV